MTGASGEPELVDGVVAVVGDSIVLMSEINNQLRELVQSGQVPESGADLDQLRRQLVEGRVEELILVHGALRDSVTLEPGVVDRQVEQQIARVEESVGGAPALQQALASEQLTLEEYRELVAGQIRTEGMIETYILQVQRERGAPQVSEEELREFFELQREAAGERPEMISFKQVVVAPTPSDSARAAALAEAEDIREQIRDGAELEELARRYSDDEGSRQQGGDLGWFRRGDMVSDFSDAVFDMRAGEVSPVVESPFGFHIIKLERSRGAERQARHILIQPEMSGAEAATARATADTVLSRLESGAEIDSLITEYGDPAERENATADSFPVQQLPSPWDQALADADAGDLVGPIELTDQGTTKWAVVEVVERIPAGSYTLEELRPQLVRQVQRQKLIEELLTDLRRRLHVEVRI